MNIYITKKPKDSPDYEFVERKGIGHPDTLSDALAEVLSVKYSNYTLEKFGAVLHHNFDKVGLLGGASFVTFGKGYLIKPIRVLLNGRASTKFGDEEIPVKEMLISWAKEFLKSRFPMINPDKDLEFHYNLSSQSSPGKTEEFESTNAPRKHWFEPRTLQDLPETKKLVSNDTSLGVGYAPHTILEQLVLKIENTLNSEEFKKENPWIGSDIKIMGYRNHDQFGITMCIPQIADHVKSAGEYKTNMEKARKVIFKISKDLGIKDLELNFNTRDNFNTMELYLTAIGSSIESGDEGLVGRGNRINGVISPTRPMSMEGACGKNPVYHIGKVYYVTANEISKKIYEEFKVPNEVALISQSGRDLLDPWAIFITLPEDFKDKDGVKKLVEKEVKSIPEITKLLLQEKIQLY
ncbi:MAG TPA: methionine adenosyltransferase [Patescibacteria group bacterium]